MIKFKETQICAKCKGRCFSSKYSDARDCLLVLCEECGYTWQMETADHGLIRGAPRADQCDWAKPSDLTRFNDIVDQLIPDQPDKITELLADRVKQMFRQLVDNSE